MANFQEPTTKAIEPLIVSIPLLSSPPSSANFTARHRKPTALSHFATKKRALSRSPSLETSNGITPDSIGNLPEQEVQDFVRESCQGKISGKKTRGKKTKNKGGRFRDKLKGSKSIAVHDRVCETTEREVDLPPLPHQSTDTPPSIGEDDEMSITSCNTTSTTGSSVNSVGLGSRLTAKPQNTQRGGRRGSRGAHSSNLLRPNTTFSFESFFSYYPATLTVRDGELVPEKSLSIKNLDQFSLPPSHPFNSWSIGQPVSGRWTAGTSGTAKNKRPRKMTNSSSKM